MTFDLYVPRDPATSWIVPGSAIVGHPPQPAIGDLPERIGIYYEGAMYDQSMTWRDALRHAADRARYSYPTIARSIVRPSEVIKVGTYDYDNDVLDITDLPTLDEWRRHFTGPIEERT